MEKVTRKIWKAFIGLFDVLEKEIKTFCEVREFCGIGLPSFEG